VQRAQRVFVGVAQHTAPPAQFEAERPALASLARIRSNSRPARAARARRTNSEMIAIAGELPGRQIGGRKHQDTGRGLHRSGRVSLPKRARRQCVRPRGRRHRDPDGAPGAPGPTPSGYEPRPCRESCSTRPRPSRSIPFLRAMSHTGAAARRPPLEPAGIGQDPLAPVDEPHHVEVASGSTSRSPPVSAGAPPVASSRARVRGCRGRTTGRPIRSRTPAGRAAGRDGRSTRRDGAWRHDSPVP